ncbi:MAG TPA: MFS transporter [Microbacteriaceae bacterium]|nr:MFS transporter [Microbacteriaceae bacterium]
MSGYRELLRSPGVGRILTAQLAARLPAGMLSLTLLIHIEVLHGSYGAAGLVLAAMSVGQGIAGPLTTRWMGRWHMRPVLALTTLVCVGAITVLALVDLSIWAAMVVGFVGGLALPPVSAAVRTIYPKIVPAQQLTPLFSLDAAAQELIWVMGPVLAIFVATQISPVIALLIAAGLMLLGGIWFIVSPELGRIRIPRPRGSIGGVLKNPVVLIATVAGFLLVANCAALEAAVVSIYGDSGAESGIIIAVWSLGSLVGGLLLGRMALTRWSLAQRFFIILVGCALAMVWLDFWWLSASLFLSGLGLAPAMAAMSAQVSSSVRFSETAESFGWVNTGQLIGAALGSAVAGFLIDGIGSIGGFFAAVGLILIALALAVSTVRWLPDLRGRDVGPAPDTQPIAML